jgi:hypothetical protein
MPNGRSYFSTNLGIDSLEQFHTPKNLAISVSIEASELLGVFQWPTDAQVSRIVPAKTDMKRIREEMAEV